MLKEENQIYWTNRAPGYSEVNQVELNTPQREIWEETLLEQLQRAFPGRAMEELSVLDVGTGPGFFAIILTELGCRVTAVEQPKSDGWAGMENLLTELVQRKRVEGMYQTFMRMLEQKAKIEVYNSRVLESAGI